MKTEKTAKTDVTIFIENIKKRIQEEIPNIDAKPYSDGIISMQLEEARHYFGEDSKNSLIDELGLEKYGWNKNIEKIRRTDKYTDSSPF